MSVQYVLDKVIHASGISDGIYSLKQILNYTSPEFPELKEIANKLSKDGYVTNLVCCEKKGDIQFELTPKGKEYVNWYKRK